MLRVVNVIDGLAVNVFDNNGNSRIRGQNGKKHSKWSVYKG